MKKSWLADRRCKDRSGAPGSIARATIVVVLFLIAAPSEALGGDLLSHSAVVPVDVESGGTALATTEPLEHTAYEEHVDALAEEYGVTPELARIRLQFEAEFIDAVTAIANGTSSYVDSALPPEFGEIGGLVLLADATADDWRFAESVLKPFGADVDLLFARLTGAEEALLLASARERLAWLEADGHPIALAWSATEDRLTVIVGGDEPGSDELSRAADSIRDLALNVRVDGGPTTFEEAHTGDCATNPTQDGGWTEGGRRILPCGVDSHNCTAGFSVRSTATPTRTGILTAAHCNDFDNDTDAWWYVTMADGDTPYSTVRYFDRADYDLGDVMFLREWFTNSLARPRVYNYDQNWTTVTQFQWENPVNATIVAKGAQTAEEVGSHQYANMYGHIEDNTVEVATNGIWPAENFYYAAGDYGDGTCCLSQLSPRPGDSGAPVWLVSTGRALGIHKGGEPGFEIYSKVGYALGNMGLQILPAQQ